MKTLLPGFGNSSEPSSPRRSTAKSHLPKLAALALLALVGGQNASAAVAAVFGREVFYTLNATQTANIKNSGFTTAILFVFDVAANGDLNYNGNHLVVQNGVWVGGSAWPARVAALKQPPTSIYRIEACTGGWGAQSWVNIKNLIAAQGTGPNSILYKNFLALRNALGIDAICNDDELAYDANSAIAFGNMVANLGMSYTLAPYTNSGYWTAIKSALGNKVDAIYLQCYDGGAGNNPASWISAFGGTDVLYPGDWSNSGASAIRTKMGNWYNSAGIAGGFVWQIENFQGNMGTFASSIIGGIGTHSDLYNIANRKSGYALYPSGGGSANNTPLIQSNNHGVWDLQHLGGGQWKATGNSSGRAVSVDNASNSDNAICKIYDYFGGSQQKFTLQDNDEDGYYAVLFVHSGKAMTVSSGSTAAGAAIVQYTLAPADSQLWQLRKGWQ